MKLDSFSDRTRVAVERLRAHGVLSQHPDLSGIPRKKQGAVLVLLYEEGSELRVLLTTRSKLLRAHPGQTALPGGKADDSDTDLVHTAFREANEEVGLPLDSPDIYTLCTLRPFLSQAQLIVTPVVAFLTNSAGVLPTLNPSAGEVDYIFDHLLEAVLDPTLSLKEPLAPRGGKDWSYPEELHNFADEVVKVDEVETVLYRHHRLRSCASLIGGLTADILICVAGIVYNRTTTYECHPPGRDISYLLDLRLKQYQILQPVPRDDTVCTA